MDSGCPSRFANIARMNRNQFFNAGQILAPDNRTTPQSAQCVPEQTLPARATGAAFELIVVVQEPDVRINNIPVRVTVQTRVVPQQLAITHALRIKSAEHWLKLCEPDRALRELEALPSRGWDHPLAVKARLAALRALKAMKAVTD